MRDQELHMPHTDTQNEYHRKRDFDRTPEPKGKGGATLDHPIFVIQKHQASSLHYDFRLEVGDVLKSWAVPKGPSKDPSEKRLAVPTEDHPREYADFEGTIPEGEYGAGTVMVWDRGTYENLSEEGMPMEEAIENGHVSVQLHGTKLQGGFALIRTHGGDRWLLIKMRDDKADPAWVPEDEATSAVTGRTLEEIAKKEE
jgi:DNA ligase D-like protein (predicted 3'-phosphoesterase)